MRERRHALGLTQAEAAAAGGLSEPVWGLLERGQQERPRARSLAAVERALRWAPGSAQAVIDGADPTEGEPAPPITTDDRLGRLEDELASLRSLLELVARQVGVEP